jgi:hypothetical protein
MTISFKRISQSVPVLFALVLVALSAATVLLPTKHAYAANAVTEPLVWADADHTNLVDAKNVVFVPLGWFCPTAGGAQITKGSGTNISIADDAKPNDSKTVDVPADTEAGSGANQVKVPKCDSAKGQAANYAWVTQFSSGTNFVLWTSGTGAAAKNNVDAQHKPINTGQDSYAALSSITGAGSFSGQKQIKVIKVDTSKAGAVDAGKASNSDNTTPTDTCPVDTWGLRWIACPLILAAQTAITKLEAVVTSWLANDVNGIFGGTNACKAVGDTSCAYYSAWNSFRVLAISLIIIAGIVMVVSEATGIAIFDAYTIRKVLPRLLISVILIAISWWLMKFTLQFFNNISIWLASLVSWPFHAVTNSDVTTSTPWSIVGQYAIIVAAIAVLGPFGILSYAGTIFMALAVGWITLVVRRMLIIMAIMSAPLFIACFIMPNTQKLGKFWRDGFIGLLLMGPVFTLAVTLGQVTAAIASRNDNGDPFGIISFACLVIPFLSIPILFSKIGGSVAGLIGFVNDKSKGGFDRLKNYRTNEIQRRGQRAKSGELFGNGLARGKLASGLNSLTSNAALGAKGNFGLGAKGKEAYEQRMAVLSGQHAKSDAGQAGQFNDDMLRAQSYNNSADARRNMAQDYNMWAKNDRGEYVLDANGNRTADTARIDRAMNAAKANGGWGKARQVYAAKQLAVTGTGYDDSQQMLQTIARASGGNESMIAAMVGDARGASKKAGRSDLGGPSFEDLHNTAVAEARAMSGTRDTNGNLVHTAPTAEHYRDLGVRAFQNTDGATLSRDKGASIKNITNDLYSQLNSVHQQARSATSEEARQGFEGQAAALTEQIKNFQQTAGVYAAPAHSRTIHENIIAPDRGERRPDGSMSGPNIIQNITNMSSPRQGNQQVVYNRQESTHPDTGETTVRYVQNVTTTGAAPAPMPHMQQQAEIYRNSRNSAGNGDLNDPRLPGHDD